MDRSHTSTARAILAVVALYGLVLQAFLAHAAPLVHHPERGWLCAPETGSDRSERPLNAHHQCCTTLQVDGAVAPPVSSVVVTPVEPAVHVAEWRPETEIPTTGPPVHAHSPRGPPSA